MARHSGPARLAPLLTLCAALVLAAASLLSAAPTSAAGPFVVNTTADTADPNVGDGACGSGGQCSLRAAVQEASHAGSATITFASSIAGQTIALTQGPVTFRGSNVTLDGSDRNVTISGAQLSGVQNVFELRSSGTTIRNLIVLGSRAAGIEISGRERAAANNQILDSRIGVAAADATACTAAHGNYVGIYVGEGATDTTISRNLIGCNSDNGIFLNGNIQAGTTGGSGTARVTITDNRIGASGATNLGNGGAGVVVHYGVSTVTVRDNLISGNGREGIFIGGSSNQVSVQRNMIGTDGDGTQAIPNAIGGVVIDENAHSNTIGGTDPASRNVISGNGGAGIFFSPVRENHNHPTVNNRVDANYIGVAADGVTPLGNAGAGIAVGPSATRARLQPLVVAYNGGLPIDLNNDGPTHNVSGGGQAGGNMLLNYPRITSYSVAGNVTTLTGTTCSGCQVNVYESLANPRAPGGGGRFLMSVQASGTNWSATLPAGLTDRDVTLVAIDAQGNTSEMSPVPGPLFLPLILKP
jgi:CSLREA domain-containing protein